VTMLDRPRSRRLPTLPFRLRRGARDARAAAPAEDEPLEIEVDIAPTDPCLAYFQGAPGPVDLDGLRLDTPGIRALRDAGVKLVVPLVAQGELIGLLNLGPRLSEQDYSADDRKLLENLAGQAAPALRVAQLVREQEAEVRRRERYEQELQVATLIQQNFLPRDLPEHPGWHLDAFYRPAREVGGDFYDVIDLPDGRLGIVVGDVTDKGVPAALVMASARSVLRASAQRLVEPGAVLRRVNDQLVPEMPPKMFVTCLYGVLDIATGRFVFANAGHNLPCVQTADGPVEPRAAGMPLGLLPGVPYDEAEVVIGVGETLVLYSDALPEAHAPDGDMFGFGRVAATVGAADSLRDAIGRLLAALDAFTGPGWEQEDDITIVEVRRALVAPLEVDTAGLGEVLDRFTVASEAGNERPAMDRVVSVARAQGLVGPRLDALGTAVAEATMNAIEHGNAGRPELRVEVWVGRDDDDLVVRIRDQGGGVELPADPELPDLEAKLRGEQSPRGWGLFLIRNMVDDLRVATDEHHHTVDLVVSVAAPEGGGDG
jgi:serine phosphatase RsbU (regulator of sigma subunit)/anti-sigma regulatory factor (Ser/Thr protein kinase)